MSKYTELVALLDDAGVLVLQDEWALEVQRLIDRPEPCWSCKTLVTDEQRMDADGYCPHCDVELAQ